MGYFLKFIVFRMIPLKNDNDITSNHKSSSMVNFSFNLFVVYIYNLTSPFYRKITKVQAGMFHSRNQLYRLQSNP